MSYLGGIIEIIGEGSRREKVCTTGGRLSFSHGNVTNYQNHFPLLLIEVVLEPP